MSPLWLGLLALLAAPLADRLVPADGNAEAWLEGFVLAVIIGAVGVLLLPEALGTAGIGAIFALGLGALGGWFVHHRLETRRTDALWIGALLAHSLLDGGTIATDPNAHSLGAAVILHNLPVGLAVWRIATREGGPQPAAGILAGMAAATAAGFFLVAPIAAALPAGALLALQCLFAGILLHPLTHLARHRGRWSSVGVACGLAAVVWVARTHSAVLA